MTDENKNQDPEKQENRTPDNVINLYGGDNDHVKREVSNQECAQNIDNAAGEHKAEAVDSEIVSKASIGLNDPKDPFLSEASMQTIPTGSEFKESVTHERDTRNNNTANYDRGQFRTATDGTAAAIGTQSRTMRILGWLSTILTAFVSPYFAIAGIIFGVLANRQERASGNAIIITNIVLAAINILFGFFLFGVIRRMMFGY